MREKALFLLYDVFVLWDIYNYLIVVRKMVFGMSTKGVPNSSDCIG